MPLTRKQIALRIAQEIKSGYVVNLGIGIPTLVASFIQNPDQVFLHSENGLLGMGPFPKPGFEDPDLINAGKQTVTAKKGASFFGSEVSFAMIRGGHIDLSILGALQVDQEASLANWMVPGSKVKGMGGAMDLVAGAKRVLVAMTHLDKNGKSKLVPKCSLPLTGLHCVNTVFTDYCVMDVSKKSGFVLKELSPQVSLKQVREITDVPFSLSPALQKTNPSI